MPMRAGARNALQKSKLISVLKVRIQGFSAPVNRQVLQSVLIASPAILLPISKSMKKSLPVNYGSSLT